jgi:hypothetical protein
MSNRKMEESIPEILRPWWKERQQKRESERERGEKERKEKRMRWN